MNNRVRIAILVTLAALPVAFLLGVGMYHLWSTPFSGEELLWVGRVSWLFVAWWPMAACLLVAYVLAHRWSKAKKLLPEGFEPPMHWTDRDQKAWQLVEARARLVETTDSDKFADPQFYFDTSRQMAEELARFYSPKSNDPFGPLTVPELLAVVELAAHDLAELVDEYVPGGHIMTIDHWKRARKAADWYRKASNVYWGVAAVVNPVQTALRYAATKFGLSAQLDRLQANVVVWFVTTYVQRVGNYLIELNSGRLKVGATRYRELRARHTLPKDAPTPAERAAAAPVDGEPAAAEPEARQVTLTLMGQVKAGKSSTVNALLGERQAVTDVLPATAAVTRYQVDPANVPSRLVLLDTVGYGHQGPREDQLRETEQAAQQSDLILLVLHARNPGRKPDVEGLDRLREWFANRPDLRMPQVLAVLTHIDLLTPAMEWAPPYDWQEPKRPKEQHIRQAMEAVRDQFGERIVGVVPVCTAEGRRHGFDEWLLPALAKHLDQAHAVALLRTLRAEADAGKVRKVFDQLFAAGKHAAQVLWQSAGR